MQTNIVDIIIVVIVVVTLAALLYWMLGRKKPEVYYFLPGEVIFKIRHQPAALPQNAEEIRAGIVAAIGEFLSSDKNALQEGSVNDTQSGDRAWRNRLALPDSTSKVITFPFTNERGLAYSLVRVPVKGYDPERDMDIKPVISILRAAYAELKQNNSLPMPNGYVIEGFSLNWLMGNLHHGGATGGPGGRPVKAPEPRANEQDFRIISSATSLINTVNIPRQTNAYVAILDTAPTHTALSNALHKWVGRPSIPDHPLVKVLFGPNGKLTVHHASPATLHEMEHFSPVLHNYLMPDHGTFIAGIINSGAPDATLHLYEVLSRYGVGTFTSVAQGFLDATRNLGRPLIINCSFMFCLPDGDYGAQLVAELGIEFDDLEKTIRELFEDIADPHIILVASAGNDSTTQARKAARYPAAFRNVIGVGALPKGSPQLNNRYVPASYSNLADDPPEDGFMTLGGEPGAGQGIRGMYISDLPGLLSSNDTGWAWWAGTSFATAIITGLLAAEITSNSGFRQPTSGETIPSGPYRTTRNEPVILVNQG